jgi:hypothetical protein
LSKFTILSINQQSAIANAAFIMRNGITALAGLAIIAAGLPVYVLLRRRNAEV